MILPWNSQLQRSFRDSVWSFTQRRPRGCRCWLRGDGAAQFFGGKRSSSCQRTPHHGCSPRGSCSPRERGLELLQPNNSLLNIFLKISSGRNRGKDNMRNLPSLPRATFKEQDDLYFRRMCLCSKNVIFF